MTAQVRAAAVTEAPRFWASVERWLGQHAQAAVRSAILGAITGYAISYGLSYFRFAGPDNFDGAGGCTLDKTPDNRDISNCYTDSPIAAGATGIITIGFDSPAKPQPFAQVAPALGRVEVAGRTATFPAIFRSTTGKLTHPRVYVQDTESKLTVTASDVTLTRQADGTFAGRSTVTVRNDGDAPHHNLQADLATPPGVEDWPFIDPADVCVGPSEGFPVPAGYFGEGCFVLGQVAEGQTRTFDWILRAPEETPAGSLGNAITRVQFSTGWPAQANAANTPSFAVTVAG
jgi:hypothetical protein